MNIYTHLIAAAISALVAYYGGYTVRDNSAKAVEMEIAVAYADALIAANKQSQEWQDKYTKGVSDARIREKQLADESAAAGRAADRLRGTVTEMQRRLSDSTAEACRRTANAALAVLGECADRYREVAAAADGHASDSALCFAAWPE